MRAIKCDVCGKYTDKKYNELRDYTINLNGKTIFFCINCGISKMGVSGEEISTGDICESCYKHAFEKLSEKICGKNEKSMKLEL